MRELLTAINIVLFCFMGLVILIAHASGFSIQKTLKELTTNFYLPSINIFLPGEIAGILWPILFYVVFSLSFIITYLLEKSGVIKYPRPAFRQKIITVTMAALFCQTALQSLNLAKYCRTSTKIFAGKASGEKYLSLVKEEPYQYATIARQALPGIHRAELITDMNLTCDPGVTTHRVLAYFLFPIDIRNIYDGPKDTLVMFNKKNARAHVPADYKIIKIFDDANLIATKK